MRNLLPDIGIQLIMTSCSGPSSPVSKPGEADSLRITGAVTDWQNLDLEKDGVFGISTNKAYAQLLKNKKPGVAVVAVFDSGIDTTREDLQGQLWTNPADGSHGRNYIVGEWGREDFIPMLDNKPNDPGYRSTLEDYNMRVQRLNNFMIQLKDSKVILLRILKNMGKDNPSVEDFKKYQACDENEIRVLGLIMGRLPEYADFAKMQFSETDHLLDLGQYYLAHGLHRDATCGNKTGADAG